MAECIHAHSADEAWLKAVALLLKSPKALSVEGRGGLTTELLHVSLTIEDPRQRWVFARHPAINPAFALTEAVWIIAGRNDSKVLNFFNRDLPRYAGSGSAFYGAYGHRLRHQHGVDQLNAAYEALVANTTSRQIVLQIWDAERDLPSAKGEPRSPDIPCNTQSMLRVQKGKLHWLQTMRSNDVFRGLPYNLVQFTTLHEVFAGWLGLELGEYTHVVNSLHYYQGDRANLEKSRRNEHVANLDSLSCSKEESDNWFQMLSDLISAASKGIDHVAQFAQVLDASRTPSVYRDIGNVILAESARRHEDPMLTRERCSRISNSCLEQLMSRSLARSEGFR